MFRAQFILGAVIGLIAGLAIVAVTHRAPDRTRFAGPILSECNGGMRELVIQYEPSAREIVGGVYHTFLGALGSNVTVRVVCPDQSAFENLCSTVGNTRCQLTPIFTHHPITTWSRDRWVALTPKSPTAPTTLLSPLGEAGDEIWPARAGDEKVGQEIAAALAPEVKAVRSEFYFDGGDFLADSDNVFVVPRVLPRNIQHTVRGRSEFLDELAGEFKRNVILLDEAPDHHAGMFMASIGGHTVLVGDPGLGKKLLPAGFDGAARLPGGPDFSAATPTVVRRRGPAMRRQRLPGRAHSRGAGARRKNILDVRQRPP